MVKEMGRVYMTDNFSIFKNVTGNRKDMEERKQKIAKSVEKVGYIPAPIIVNEKMEIIDGQARFAYCRENETSIAYYVIDGLTIDDCIAMNISASNWQLEDYIMSYADRAFPSYVLAEKFIENSPYSIKPTLWALAGTDASNLRDKIMNGSLKITDEAYRKGREIIDYWTRFDDIHTNSRAIFLIAIGYCYLIPDVDNDMLDRKLHLRPKDFQSISSVTDAIDSIEDAYNIRTRNHVYIETEYFKYLDRVNKGLAKIIKSKRN